MHAPRLLPVVCSILLAVASAVAPIQAAEAPAAVDDPVRLAEAAVASHPSVAALRENVEALRQAGAAARLWSDPLVAAEISNLPITSPTLDSHPMAGVQLKVQQRFPAPGEPAARAALADARVREAESAVDEAATALGGEVRARYWDLAFVRQLRSVTVAHLRELDGMLEAVRARYEVGVAEQHDLLQLQLRRDSLAEDLRDFDAREEAILAALNGALARPPDAPILTPASLPLGDLVGDREARRAALQTHPAVAARQRTADRARASARRAVVEARPEPTVWLGYRIRAGAGADPGTNFVTAGVSVPLPAASIRRGQADAAAAEARARGAEQAAEGVLDRLGAQLAAAEARFARAAERSAAYRDSLVPAATTTLDSTLSAYQVDRARFADLIRASIDVLSAERSLLQAEAEAAAARADILTLVGHSLPAASDRP